jgi:hypothetical protein
VAHLCTDAVASYAAWRCRGVTARSYIDNVRFAANSIDELRRALSIFYETCAAHGVDVNEPIEEALRCLDGYTYLGCVYHLIFFLCVCCLVYFKGTAKSYTSQCQVVECSSRCTW